MAVLSDYTSGTISLANGSTAVTGTGTLFEVTRFREGDTLQIQNLTAVIASVNSDTSLTLTEPWTGSTIVDGPYRARQLGDISRYPTQAATIIDLLGNGVLTNIAEIPVEEGKLLRGNAAGQYEAVPEDEIGLQDPNGSLGKLAGLMEVDNLTGLAELELAARQILQTDENGELIVTDLVKDRVLTTNGSGDLSFSTYAGEVVMLPGGTIPAGRSLLKLNGAAINRATYADLYQYAGDSGMLVAQSSKTPAQFGTGDGSTTFTIPDWRGYFIRAWDDGRGIDAGRVLSVIQAMAMQGHKHQLPFGFDGNGLWPAIFNSPINGPVYGSTVESVIATSTSHSGLASSGIARVAQSSDVINQSGETRPINLSALFAIRY